MTFHIPLTAEQIKHFDEIALDKQTADYTLKIALNYHSNAFNNIKKDERKFWEELAQIYRLDLENKVYTIKTVDRQCCIVEKDSSDAESI